MKLKRNLSGIYFRAKENNGHWGNRCFEDLSEEDQKKYMENRSNEWLQSLALQLAKTINQIGDQFDVMKD